LTTLCPIDILRNTLGVGPCQYILQTEGLASAANPTPDNVMSWVEKQFARKKEKSQAGEIRDLLQQMTEHMGHVQGRIAQYRALARDLRTLLDDKTVPSVASRDVGGLRRTLDYMEQAISATGAGAPEPRPEAQLAARVAGLIGKPDASAECRQLGQELRRLGAAGDRTMSCCRMAARWLKEQARMMANDSQSAALAQSIERRTQQVLTTN
jgi:Mg2+ and Co2+ transporter CorA